MERALAQGENNYHEAEAAELKYEIYVNITRGLNSAVSVSPSVSWPSSDDTRDSGSWSSAHQPVNVTAHITRPPCPHLKWSNMESGSVQIAGRGHISSPFLARVHSIPKRAWCSDVMRSGGWHWTGDSRLWLRYPVIAKLSRTALPGTMLMVNFTLFYTFTSR